MSLIVQLAESRVAPFFSRDLLSLLGEAALPVSHIRTCHGILCKILPSQT